MTRVPSVWNEAVVSRSKSEHRRLYRRLWREFVEPLHELARSERLEAETRKASVEALVDAYGASVTAIAKKARVK